MDAIGFWMALGLLFLGLAWLAENTARGRALIDAVDRRIEGTPPPVRHPFPDHDAEPGDWRS